MKILKITTMSIGTIFINSSRVLGLPKMSHHLMTYVVNGQFQTAETLVFPVRVSCPELLLLIPKYPAKQQSTALPKELWLGLE
jgi:hypothetical protein